MSTEWKFYDRDKKTWTAPPPELHNEPLWINEQLYHGVTIGYFDGFTWHTFAGSDDVQVTHWAPIEYPTAPAGTGQPK